ncbi:MAG: response regulator, partial [Gemmatimonadaceae bacterium]|nr:response regulator [Gemmatimonadaceae bacterium]
MTSSGVSTVLVVDDSAFMRRMIAQIVDASPGFRVIGTARNGLDAIRQIHELDPNIVTLDVEMPELDGVQTLGYIMSEVPRAVVMLSAATSEGGVDLTLRCLELGAVDFVKKPSGPISLDLALVTEALMAALGAAREMNLGGVSLLARPRFQPTAPFVTRRRDCHEHGRPSRARGGGAESACGPRRRGAHRAAHAGRIHPLARAASRRHERSVRAGGRTGGARGDRSRVPRARRVPPARCGRRRRRAARVAGSGADGVGGASSGRSDVRLDRHPVRHACGRRRAHRDGARRRRGIASDAAPWRGKHRAGPGELHHLRHAERGVAACRRGRRDAAHRCGIGCRRPPGDASRSHDMIERHWKLARRPFANTPDPAFVYRSPVFAEGLARLLYDATELRGGLSLVTGEIGCGKTMLAHALAAQLAGSTADVIALPYPKVTPTQLLATVARGVGLTPPRGKLAVIEALGVRLAELQRNGRRPVLVVDEAQLASPSLLEEIRLLTNYEDQQDKHLHVVLLGQPELRERVRARPQIDQRVSLRFHVEPMEEDEVGGYVEHRMRVAGRAGGSPFTADALRVLATRSGGVPRRVNTLATQA